MKNETSILRAKNLSKAFYTPIKVQVLNHLSLEVKEGESIAIMGKSGEGKSTLLHILGTLEKPCSGNLEICGQPFDTIAPTLLRNKHIGFIFQGFHLLEDYTAYENVLMPAKIARKPTGKKSSASKRALELLDQVGLSTRAHFFIKQLSGGEKQRVAIARALCNDPDLILADEPSGNLDRINSSMIHELLITSAKKLNKTLIVVTHDLELSNLCDRKLLLKDGMLCDC